MFSPNGFFVSQRFGRILSVAFLLLAGSVFEGRAQLAFPVINSFEPSNGRSGTTVTISGENLANSTLLVFNRSALLPGSFKVVNGTTVTAQVPVGASSGRLRLTTASGTGAKGTATVSGGQVTAITFSSGGTGYDSSTKINLLGGSGSGASADLVLNGGTITGVANLIGGSNYVSAPTVVLANYTATSAGDFTVTAAATNIVTTLVQAVLKDTGIAGDLVGTLSAAFDGSTDSAATFALVNGTGSTDNSLVKITGNQLTLRYGGRLDAELKPALSLRIRATDSTGVYGESVIAVTVTLDTAKDVDQDGLTLAQEKAIGTSDLKSDTDGDGSPDGNESDATTAIPSSYAGAATSSAITPPTLLGWGNNYFGQITQPVASGRLPAGIIQVSGGYGHSVAVTSNGAVYAWGDDEYGQATAPELAGVWEVVGGIYHSLALKSDGTVEGWGAGAAGTATGTEPNFGQATPPDFLPANPAVALAAGGYHSVALRADGTVVAWGNDDAGQTEVPTGLDRVVGIAAGLYHNVALRADGTIRTWGLVYNGTGYDLATQSLPVLSEVKQVAAGSGFSAALLSNGTVRAWGKILSGSSYVDASTAMAGLTEVTEIVAGAHHLVALLSNGTVRVVGRADEGEATLPSAATQSINRIGAGAYHAFAIRAAPSLPTLSGVGTYASIGQPLNLTLPTGAGTVLGLPDGFVKNETSIQGTFSQAAFRVLRVAVGNSAGTVSALTAIGTPKITASLTLSGLTASYTGSPVSVTVSGKPDAATGTVKITYTGIDVVYPESETAPTLAGQYLVKAEIIGDAVYEGSITGTLIVSQKSEALLISVADSSGATLSANTDGSYNVSFGQELVVSGTATTSLLPVLVETASDNQGLVTVVQDFLTGEARVAVGSYSGEIRLRVYRTASANYADAETTIRLKSQPAAVTLSASSLTAAYDGSEKKPTLSTGGQDVALTYEYRIQGGSAYSSPAPTAAGNYEFQASVTTPGYSGIFTGAFTIVKSAAAVSLSGLTQDYAGTPRSVTVATIPPALNTSVTYVGSDATHTAVGTYSVTATVTDPNFTGEATETMTIQAAAQEILFSVIPNQSADAKFVTAYATGDSSTQPVTLAVSEGAAEIGSTSTSQGVRRIVVANGGSNYTSVPTVQISGGATAEAKISGGKVVSIEVTSTGTGYSSAPQVAIEGNGGASATAFLGPQTVGTVAILGTGRISIRASQAGDANHATAADVTRTFVVVPAPVSRATTPMVASGRSHTLYLSPEGIVFAAGANMDGRLGMGDGANLTGLTQMTFVNSRQKSNGEVVTLDEVSAVSAGGQFSLFLRADGTVYAAGSNLFGQLGAGTNDSFRGVAQQVLNSSGTALTKITTISAGVSHALAVDEDGNAWGWGDNSSGQLGTSVSGTSASRATKITSGVLAVAAGARHSFLLTQAGAVLAYGADDFGQKTGASGITSQVVSVASGENHGLAVDKDGRVWSWGDNRAGEVSADGTVSTQGAVRRLSSSLLVDVISVAAGAEHSLALTTEGKIVGWGQNRSGQLGNGTLISSTPYAGGAGLFMSTTLGTSISAGGYHSAVISSGAAAFSVGLNTSGECANGTKASTVSTGPRIPSALVFTGRPVLASFIPTTGDVGTLVTITGGWFGTSPATTVTFAGSGTSRVSATDVTVATPYRLTAKVPAGFSAGSIQVSRNGITATSGTDFGGSAGGSVDFTFSAVGATSSSFALVRKENVDAAGAQLGSFVADSGNNGIFYLKEGEGDTDNSSFDLQADGTLLSKKSFDYETKSSYSLRTELRQPNGSSQAHILTIQIEDDAAEDNDEDGLTQAEEAIYGSSDQLTDTDGDGLPDGFEVATGTLPAFARPVASSVTGLTASEVTPASFRARWNPVTSSSSISYQIEVSTSANFTTLLPDYPKSEIGTDSLIEGLTSGTTYYYRVQAVDGTSETLGGSIFAGGKSDYYNLTTVAPAPVITAVATASGQVGVPFTLNFDIQPSVTSFTLVSGNLPAGLTLVKSGGSIGTATLSGTPTQAATSGVSLVFTAVGPTGSDSKTVALTIQKGRQTIQFTAPVSTGAIGYQTDGISLSATSVIEGSSTPTGLNPIFSVAGAAELNGASLSLTGIGTVAVTASQPGDDNYEAATSVQQSFTVNPYSQNLSFVGLSDSVTYQSGLTLPLAANSDRTGQNNFAYSVISGPGSILDGNLLVSGAGSIVVQVSESGGDLVAAASADKTIEVRKATNTIEFSDIGYQTIGDGVSLSATSSSGLSVSFQVVENSLVPNVAPEFTSISSDVLTTTQAGWVRVRASQGGNANYDAATAVEKDVRFFAGYAVVSLGDLVQVSSESLPISVSTDPEGLAASTLYAGNAARPSSEGEYEVDSIVQDSAYAGRATGKLLLLDPKPTLALETVTGEASEKDTTGGLVFAVLRAGGDTREVTAKVEITFAGGQKESKDVTLPSGQTRKTFQVSVRRVPADEDVTVKILANSAYNLNPVSVEFSGGNGAVGVASVRNGAVDEVVLSSGGSGYSANPLVKVRGGGVREAELKGVVTGGFTAVTGGAFNSTGTSRAAAAQAILGDGKVIGFKVTDPGSNYVTAPSVRVTGGTTAATGTATIAGGKVTEIRVVSGQEGSGFTGKLTDVEILEKGEGYTSIPSLALTEEGAGSGASLVASVRYGRLSGVQIESTGSGYTGAPTVTVSGGGVREAEVTAIASNGQISELQLVDGGEGYRTETAYGKIIDVDGQIPAISELRFTDESLVGASQVAPGEFLYCDGVNLDQINQVLGEGGTPISFTSLSSSRGVIRVPTEARTGPLSVLGFSGDETRTLFSLSVKDTLSRIELPPGANLEESYSNTGSRPTRSPISLTIYARSGSSGQVAPVTGVTLVLGGTDRSRFSLSDASLIYTPVVNEDLDFEGTLPNTKQKLTIQVTASGAEYANTLTQTLVIPVRNSESDDDDSDGLTESQEKVKGTNPLAADTDADGVADGTDPWPTDAAKVPANLVSWATTPGSAFLPPTLPTNSIPNLLAAGPGYSLLLAANTNTGQSVVRGSGSVPQGTNFPGDFSAIKSLAAGSEAYLALTDSGRVIARGSNAVVTNLPFSLSGGTNGYAVGVGNGFGAAVLRDGTVKVWGDTNGVNSQLISTCATNPNLTNPSLAYVRTLAAGPNHLLFLRANGTVFAAGANAAATNVPAGLSSVIAVATGTEHSLALRSDGTVVAWGEGASVTSTDVWKNLRDVVAIAAGGKASVAIFGNGKATSWGEATVGTFDEELKKLKNVYAVAVAANPANPEQVQAVAVCAAPVARLQTVGQMSGTAGKSFVFQLKTSTSVAGTTNPFASTSLPEGLSLNRSSGLVSGTPTAATSALSDFRVDNGVVRNQSTTFFSIAWGAPVIGSFSPSSGAAGARVTVSGSNFFGAQVSLNGTPLSATISTAGDSLVFTVPTGASSGTIGVRTATGNTFSAQTFEVLQPPLFTGFQPSAGPAGTAVVLKGEWLAEATKVAFTKSGAAGATTEIVLTGSSRLDSKNLRVTVPADAVTGKVTITTPVGSVQSPIDFRVQRPPTAISLSSLSVDENLSTGTVVGDLTATDEPGSVITFALVSGVGSAENMDFRIVGSRLATSAEFDFEKKSSYSIRIRATNQDGLSLEKAVTILIANRADEDSDADGLTEVQELALGTSDLSADTDKDGVNDKADLFPTSPAPFPPSGLRVLSATTGATLNWNPVNAATGYRLDLAKDAAFGQAVVADLRVSSATYTTSGLSPNTTYYARVRTVAESVGSRENTSLSCETFAFLTKPAAPSLSSAGSSTTTTTDLSWTASAGATSYRLDVSLNPSFTQPVTGYFNKPVSSTSLKLEGLDSGTAYYIRVRAANADGEGDSSATVLRTTLPAAPTALAASSINKTSNQFTANWTTVKGATSYRLDVATTASFVSGTFLKENQTVSGTSYVVDFPAGTTQVYYRARAVGVAGTGDDSNLIDILLNKKTQTITFATGTPTSLALVFNGATATVTATSDAKLPVSYSSSDTSIFTVTSAGVLTARKAGTAQLLVAQDGDSTYLAGSAFLPVIVNPATLPAVTFAAPTLTYNGSEKIYTASAAGVNGFSYQYIGVSGTAYLGGSKPPTGVGTYQVTAISTDGNYTGSTSQTFAITAATLPSVAFTAPISGLTYNGNAKNYSASASGVSSLSYRYTGIGATSYDSISAPVNVGSYRLTVTSSDPNYVGSSSQDFSIAAQTVLPTVTFQFPATGLTYSGSPKAFVASAQGVSGFSHSYVGLSPTVYPESATPPTQVGTYRVTATSTDKNYVGSSSQVFTITGVSLTPGAITFNYPASLTYDGTVKSFTASGQGVSGFSYSYAGRSTTVYGPSTTAPYKAGKYKVTATSTDPNYVGSQDESFDITPASVVLTFSGIEQTYDKTSKKVSVSTSPAGIATTVTYNGSISEPVNAGSYNVEATVADANYAGKTTGVLKINKAENLVTFGSLENKTFGDAAFSLSGSASSGLQVNYDSSSSGVATVSGSNVTIVGAGQATITARQSGNENYLPAAPVQQSLTVSSAPAILILGNLQQVYDGREKSVEVSTVPVGLQNRVTYDGESKPPVNAGSYVVAGSVTESNYTGSTTSTLVVTPATPTITAPPTPSSIKLGQSVGSATLSGGIASVPGSFAYATPSEIPSSVGTFSKNVDFSPTDSANYSKVTIQVSVTVNPANTAPTLANIPVGGTEDQVLTFTQANFAGYYTDPENNPLASITVKTLPATGTLKLGSAAVTADQVIPSAQISTLNYMPASNANGVVGFTVTASDGSLSSSTASVNMNIAPVNDAPTFGGMGYGPTYIQESFASASLLTGSISGNASISGGECVLTPASSYQYGELAMNKLGAASPTAFSAQFDYRVNDGTGADGTSFSYGARANGFSGEIENGLGNGLAVRLIEWGGSHVEVVYNGSTLTSVPFALMNPNYRTVVIQVDLVGQLSVSIGGTSVLSNISLPAAYATADKSAWQFVFAARCGGANNKHSLKNLLIRGIRVGIPSEFTFTEDQPGNLLFPGNLFADVDSTYLTVALSIEDGTITGNSGPGVVIGGTATARTFAGTVADLNAYFTTAGKITYQGAQDNAASRSLAVEANDTAKTLQNFAVGFNADGTGTNGWTGVGANDWPGDGNSFSNGTLVATATGSSSLGSAPLAAGTYTVQFAHGLPFANAAPGTLTVSAQAVADGSSTPLSTLGTSEVITLRTDTTWTTDSFTFTIPAGNSAVGKYLKLTFNHSKDQVWHGIDNISVSVLGSSTPGLTATELATIIFTPVNDAPTLTTPTAISYQDTSAADIFTAQSGNLMGADLDTTTLTYGVSGGTIGDGNVTMAGTYGTLTVVTATGAYTFTPKGTAINALTAPASETYEMSVSDGAATASANLVVSITAAVPEAQSISFGSLASKNYGDPTFSLTATANSGLTVSYASSDTSVATVNGSTVTLMGTGTTQITASQVGNAAYGSAQNVVQTLTVLGSSQTVTRLSSATTTLKYDETLNLETLFSPIVNGAQAGESNLALAILDANPIGLVRSITLSGLSTARPYNVQLTAQIAGTGEGAFLGDYTLLLRHYTTGESIVEQTAILLNQNDLISNGLNATFSSNYGNAITLAEEAAGSPLTGTYRSNGLSALGGMDPNGVWQLFVGDASGGATGNLVGWSLRLDEVPLVGTSGPSPVTYEIVGGTGLVSRNANSITAISGTGQFTVRAVAAATTGYSEGSQTVVISLEKITPKITQWPTASSIFLGQTLASSTLTGGSADISGAFTFASPSTAPAVGTSSQSVIFTPTPSASANYNTATALVSVTTVIPQAPTSISATGGTISTSGEYTIHTFTNVGSSTFKPTGSGTVEILVVAGGGGAGFDGGGGGGAGGVITNTVSVAAGTDYTVVVGAGGAAAINSSGNGVPGVNSQFGALTAIGGAGGYSGHAVITATTTGGSGGGEGFNGGGPGLGTPGQGNQGGTKFTDSAGGGGGGAGAVGGNATSGKGGNGGNGIQSDISGVATWYGGGGAGGSWNGTGGTGGLGGGGNAGGNSARLGSDGTPNTGGGGGGNGYADGATSGKGGSGIVIVRYKNAFGSAATFTTAPTSYIDIPNALTGDFTICFRLKTTEQAGEWGQWYRGRGLVDGEIGGVANDFGVCLADGRIAFGIGNPDVTLLSNSSVNDGVWHAIAVTRSGSVMKIYIDGVENASEYNGPTGGRQVTNLRIGMQATGANGSLSGQIDDVRFYTSASTSYVLAAITGPLTTFPETNLAAYYPMDGNANDASGNNRNGTPVNVSWSPGQSPGVWDLAQGDYQLENDGNRLLLELGGEKPLYDQIFVRNGAATLDGIVNLMFYGTYTGPISGSWQTFDLVWAQNGIVFGDDYQLIFNQAGYTVDTAVVEKDGGQLWQATVREVVTQEDLEQAAALAQPALGVAKSPGANGTVEMMYTYTRPAGGSYVDGRYVVGGVSYEIQYSSDLKIWVGATVEEVKIDPSGDGMEEVTVRVISNSNHGFLKLKVSQ